MGYNTSTGVVNRNLHYLDALYNARQTLTWPSREPSKLAYKIREACYAVRVHKQFSKYHPLMDWYRIREHTGWVEAEYIGPPPGTVTPEIPSPKRIEDVTDVHGVVGACIQFGAAATEVHFPNAVLSEDELLAVYEWGLSESPRWHLISHSHAGITMTRRTDIDAIFFWLPEHGLDGD